MSSQPTALLLVLFSATVAAAPSSPPPFYSDKQDLMYYLDASGTRQPVRSPQDWEKRRRHLLANMQLVMGPLPAIDHNLPLALEILKEGRGANYTWRRITYAAERGDRAYAYLYIPSDLGGRRVAGIVSLHGTTYRNYVPLSEAPPNPKPGTGDAQYAQELAARG
mgnify:FL=1